MGREDAAAVRREVECRKRRFERREATTVRVAGPRRIGAIPGGGEPTATISAAPAARMSRAIDTSACRIVATPVASSA